jgi:hypothetical protein
MGLRRRTHHHAAQHLLPQLPGGGEGLLSVARGAHRGAAGAGHEPQDGQHLRVARHARGLLLPKVEKALREIAGFLTRIAGFSTGTCRAFLFATAHERAFLSAPRQTPRPGAGGGSIGGQALSGQGLGILRSRKF